MMKALRHPIQDWTWFFISLAALIAVPQVSFSMSQDTTKPFHQLLDIAGVEVPNASLFPFEDYEDSFYPKIHATNMEYFKNNPDLLEKIRTDLNDRTLHWTLKTIIHRRLYVSENRSEYIELFEAYCKTAIAEILSKIKLPNPYDRIITLTGGYPPPNTSNGVCAYIVQDLAREYQVKYEFRNTIDQAVVIELDGSYPSSDVGSYSSYLSFDENKGISFKHDNFTIWQNNSKNPYTVLMTPVEETLHILLRESTESAIKKTVELQGNCSLEDAERIVDDWISVEEAVVGGLVYHLLPPILEKYVGILPDSLIPQDINYKKQIPKYRRLEKGIHLVDSLGYEACIRLYMENPETFKRLL